jgi:hypothetical protein
MRRFRFRLRSLMILVAIVAVAIGAELTRRRSVFCRRKSAAYARQEATGLATTWWREAEGARMRRDAHDVRELGKRAGDEAERTLCDRTVEAFQQGAAIQDDRARSARQQAIDYGRLEEKYRRAASCPWQAVDPHPPE